MSTRRLFAGGGLGALLLWAGLGLPAEAKKDANQGVEVRIRVMDEAGEPIPTAVVRHPEEADRRRVNSVTGEWMASVLYLPDGSELIFVPGMSLQLEISAPGFMTQVIQYDIRKRKNVAEVTLQALKVDEETIDEPMIQFGRDRPRDVGGSGPAN
jgi:hypothetical protein